MWFHTCGWLGITSAARLNDLSALSNCLFSRYFWPCKRAFGPEGAHPVTKSRINPARVLNAFMAEFLLVSIGNGGNIHYLLRQESPNFSNADRVRLYHVQSCKRLVFLEYDFTPLCAPNSRFYCH